MIRNAFLNFPMNACNFVKLMRNDQHIGTNKAKRPLPVMLYQIQVYVVPLL